MGKREHASWDIGKHIDHNVAELHKALDTAEASADSTGAHVRRAVTSFSRFDSPKVGNVTFVHVRHFIEHGFFEIRVNDFWTTVDTVEEVEAWVRKEFGVVAEPWRPEW
ncbi:MAG: hypothetical protein ACXWQ5_01030 [Ktedonobacterales bacterium]